MSRIQFPQEPLHIAAMAQSLAKANLSDVHRIVEELTDLSQKTGVIAQEIFTSGLFEAAMQRTEELGDQEMTLNHQICHWREEINDLIIDKDQYPPEEIAMRLNDLQERIFSCTKPTTITLQKQLNDLQKECNHLHFLFSFPLAEELNPDSFMSNVIHRISSRTEKLKDRDPEKIRLQKMLNIFQQECQAAEQVFAHQGLSDFRKLPSEIRLAIEQRLFSRFPELSIESEREEDHEIIARAIMSDLSDRMVELEN